MYYMVPASLARLSWPAVEHALGAKPSHILLAVVLDVWAAIVERRRYLMVAPSYESALQMAVSLSREEQLRLIHELMAPVVNETTSKEQTSVLALCGLGQEIWQRMDAQEYVRRERSSWNG
jgi:hypothetical protein